MTVRARIPALPSQELRIQCCSMLQHDPGALRTMTVTVPQAAKRVGKNPETIRRWIREGRLPAQKVGTQHMIDERDLQALASDDVLPAPEWWNTTATGEPMPDWVAIIRRQRAEH
jgi:excisionase family DNA binding protein